VIELFPTDGGRVPASAVSFDPALDLRRLRPPRIRRLTRFAVVFEPLEPSESEEDEEEEESSDDSIHCATGPGADSSSMMC